MKRINLMLVVLLVFVVPTFIVSLSGNIIIKSEEVYSFYFNDSRAVDKITTEYTANEMAEIISDFMKSKAPEKFEVREDTGYDMESVFSDDDGHNMMRVKYVVDISYKLCIATGFFMVFTYYWLLRKDKKYALRISFLISTVFTVALTVGVVWATATETGRKWTMEKLDMTVLNESSQLARIIGPDFQSMAVIAFAFLSFLILVAMTYISLLLTKEERMFSD